MVLFLICLGVIGGLMFLGGPEEHEGEADPGERFWQGVGTVILAAIVAVIVGLLKGR